MNLISNVDARIPERGIGSISLPDLPIFFGHFHVFVKILSFESEPQDKGGDFIACSREGFVPKAMSAGLFI